VVLNERLIHATASTTDNLISLEREGSRANASAGSVYFEWERLLDFDERRWRRLLDFFFATDFFAGLFFTT
jgi:hypothetical protein